MSTPALGNLSTKDRITDPGSGILAQNLDRLPDRGLQGRISDKKTDRVKKGRQDL